MLEDVDKGSADLPILLSPVLRHACDSASNVVHPNTGEVIKPHPDFRLILTKRTNVFGFAGEPISEIYDAHCCLITMKAMDCDVIERVSEFMFP